MIARTKLGRTLAVCLSVALSQALVPVAWAATPHLVGPDQVRSRLSEQAAARAEQVRLVQEVLGTAEARRQGSALGLRVDRLRAAVPHLSDTELQDLSQRAANVKDVAAGHSTDEGVMVLGLILLLAGLAILVALGDYDDYYDCYCY